MIDYQNDYKTLYEELRSLVRLYFETVNAEEVEDEDDWADAVMNTELDLCLMVGLIEDEDLDD